MKLKKEISKVAGLLFLILLSVGCQKKEPVLFEMKYVEGKKENIAINFNVDFSIETQEEKGIESAASNVEGEFTVGASTTSVDEEGNGSKAWGDG